MSCTPTVTIIILVLVLFSFVSVSADTPPDNTLPIIGMRVNGIHASFEGIRLPLLCRLSWLHFDGVEAEGEAGYLPNRDFMSLCGEAGMLLVLAPQEIVQYYCNWNPVTSYWFRWSDYSLTSDRCFGQTSCNEEQTEWYYPHNFSTAQDMHSGQDYSISTTVINQLSNYTVDYPALWFYDVYDEAPSRQRLNMIAITSVWDDWLPNMYTQAWDDEPNPPVPALSEVEPAGIFSWQKYLAENNIVNIISTTLNFSLLHTIQAGEYTGFPGCNYGTMARQAISVRAICEAMYQAPPEGGNPPEPLENSPEFICFDYYPFRYVDMDYAETTTICDDDWLFLINHFEEGIDSTVIPAAEYDIPVFFYPQAFGMAGGPLIRDAGGNLDYHSYQYRTPSAQELLMLCNLGLLHQVKAIFPYSLASFVEVPNAPDAPDNFISSSLFDLHFIPFNAQYEDWVYTGRWPDQGEWEGKYEYANPRLLPPFRDGFDPLYELPSAPVPVPGDPKNLERWFTWFFDPYGNLYNSLENTLGQIAWIAPEMYNIWWFEDAGIPYWDVATISSPDSDYYEHYVAPEIKVFKRDGSNTVYLYYVNRYCRSEELPVHVSLYGVDIPYGYLLSETALDHSRRFLFPVDLSPPHGHYSFDDTLAAGEARLIEFVETFPATPADLRITSPDVFRRPVGSLNKETDLRCTAGTSVELGATFYNLGTSSADPVTVTFRDVTDPDIPHILGTDQISFSGLSQDYQPDSSAALITWNTNSDDIGAHIIEISTSFLSGEPDPDDNSVQVTFLVEPQDYATEARNDPWDMSEGGSNPWLTDDIASVALNWDDTAWTDSVSNMFEGVLEPPPFGEQFFKGDIMLDMPGNQSGWINTDEYRMISLAGVSNNPNINQPSNGCTYYLFWRDERENFYIYNISSVMGGLGDGWDQWKVFESFNMENIAGWSGMIHEIGFRFQAGIPDPHIIPQPIDIRIGWIRLENGEI